ncbi:elongation factor G, partial [candidate division KSB1 bacterium]
GINFPRPVIQEAVEAKSKGDEDKISNGLARLHEEDPTFESRVDPDLKQTLVSGMGELHLEVIIGRLKRKFGVEVEMIKPKIPYRETIRGTAEASYRHKKQTGGRGQFGEVSIRVQPRGRSEGFEFVNAISGGVIPSRFIPGVEKGIVEAMAAGVQAGCQVIDMQVTLFDGKHHPVDSSEMAFKIAGSQAFKKAFLDATPSILEPIYELTVKVPEDYMGDVIGDLSSRRGKILGMDAGGGKEVIKAMVPLAEMYRYSTHLRSMTQGRGSHSMIFKHYEDVPSEVAQVVIKEAAETKEG